MGHEKLADMVQSTRPGGYEAYPKSNSLEYSATRLGKAPVPSSLAPEDGFFIHGELQKSLGSFVMDCDMQSPPRVYAPSSSLCTYQLADFPQGVQSS
jgi:hypothetical protein